MSYNAIEKQYREAVVQGATPVGLTIMLYDVLVADLRRAIAAIEAHQIDARCEALKHGFLVLQQLEGTLDCANGGESAKSLMRFYSYVRGKMMEAQMKTSASLLREQVELILDVRSAWHQVEGAKAAEQISVTTSPSVNKNTYGNTGQPVTTSSWSA